ncbi:hypothetical protein JCM33374_g2148 [Metschnikowia sp. JCM 33374]|nr:hypothetical protein JCM33374_g2148 [Metschnikowia sp. JCM 33374]
MKSQTSRGGRQNSFSGSPSGPHQGFAQGYAPQRKSSVKYGNANTNTNTTAIADSHNRLISLLANAKGKSVVATVSSGARYRGVLSSLNIGIAGDDALSIILVKPTLVSKSLINEKSNIDQKLPAKLVIESKDLIDIELFNAFKAGSPEIKEKSPELLVNSPTGTTTETTIPPETKEPPSAFKTDRDISAGFNFKERELQRWVPDEDTPELTLEGDTGGAWDQFKVNEERFGVESSYDEHLYTTKINTEAKDYKDRLLRAERLAKEIEGSTSSDQHVLEERGVAVDDSGLDEEDKYSGVIQDNTVDNRGNELMAALRSASISNESVPIPTGEGKYTTPRQRAAQYHNDPAIVSSSATRKPDAPNRVASPVKNVPKVVKPAVPSIPPKPQVSDAQGESFRLNAQSEFNALREFSANFKIPHKIPNDLLPILAKDKLKQDEILRKQEKGKSGAKEQVSSAPPPKVPSSSNSPALPKSTVLSVKPEPKKEATKFKLNPKAAAFTPSRPPQMSPVPPKANFSKSPNNASPRMHNQRPYSNSSAGSSGRRHYQISAVDFFGGADKVPTTESQKQKIKAFRTSFNMFATAVRKHGDKTTPLILEKAFKTPPTWDSTVDESYDKVIAKRSASTAQHLSPAPSHFMASPIMPVPNGVPPMMAGGYIGTAGTGGKFSMSPHIQQPMAQYQQPFHPSMMYPQFQGGVPPGQPQVMYAPPGVDPSLFPPGGFMVPGYMGNPAPMNGGGHTKEWPRKLIKSAKVRVIIMGANGTTKIRGPVTHMSVESSEIGKAGFSLFQTKTKN